jgi:hypothetical protein
MKRMKKGGMKRGKVRMKGDVKGIHGKGGFEKSGKK